MNYRNVKFKTINIDTVCIALREFGQGKDIFFIHGFPTHGYTWRKIIPKLSNQFKCNVIDLPGLGDSKWSSNSKLDSGSQALYVLKLIELMGVNSCHLVAHNSGATIARIIAFKKPDLIEKLILVNTEIPNHRPPWIPFYQKIGLLPLLPYLFRKILRRKWFINAPMGFKEFYSNKSMLNEESNIQPYLRPILSSKKNTIGALKFLKGIDWKLVDDFKESHKNIKANVLFLWGEDDKTFPIKLGKEMATQFSSKVQFVSIKNSSLLPHEERHEEVSNMILSFISNG